MAAKKNHKNEKISKRLLELIDKFGNGKPATFCKIADIPGSTFQYYINGRMPHGDHLIRIHEKFGVRIDWILTGHGDMTEKIEPYNVIIHNGKGTQAVNTGNINLRGKDTDTLSDGMRLLMQIVDSGDPNMIHAAITSLQAMANSVRCK